MRPLIAALCALFILSACDSTQSLVALKHAAPSTDPYFAALADDYQRYAEQKQSAYAWWTSRYFADKGLMAAYGTDVVPEDPTQWPDLADAARQELADARAQLLAALPAARTAQPDKAAHTLSAFDAWVVLADNGWDTPRIDEARDRFFSLLGALQAITADAAAPASPAPTAVETTSTILYFPFDRASLSGSASLALEQLVAYVKSAGHVGVTINGHADRVGTDEYNMTLSQARAKFVNDALLRAGVPASVIHYFAFGESDPAIDTPDGEAEPLNRRVEIFIE